MPRNRKDVEAGLSKKGFQRRDGDHHFFIYLTADGRKSRVFTKTSHSVKDITDDLLSQMARQCKVTKQSFFRLIDCPLLREEYEKILYDTGWL